MTRAELCDALQAPDDTPAGDLLASWQRRRSELGAALAAEGSPKPVKLRLRGEMQRLDAAEPIAAQLRLAAEFERYYAEFLAEQSKPQPVRGVMGLCLTKAQEMVPQITDSELRFRCEKKLAAGPSLAAAASMHEPSEPSDDWPAVLELRPVDTGATGRRLAPPIRMIARGRFTLGRQSGNDLVARFLPETPENQQKTSTISRVNTTLFVRGNQLWVRDGHETEGQSPRPSRNGTFIDEVPIAAPVPLNLTKERRFRLGQFGFEVRARHFPGSAEDGGKRVGDNALHPGPGGCVRFESVGHRRRPEGVNAAESNRLGARRDLSPESDLFDAKILWMLSEAIIGSGPEAAVPLPPEWPAVAARILFSNRIFQLQVPAVGSAAVTLDGRACGLEGPWRLNDDQELCIGEQRFTVHIT